MFHRPDLLPVPESCDNCASLNIAYSTVSKEFANRLNAWPNIWVCKDCGASIGCHPNTNLPLGKMAGPQTRKLRIKAHAAFDPIWQTGLMRRDQAYAWLARQLGIGVLVCHISWLTQDHLKKAISLSENYVSQNKHKAEKRKEKRRARTELANRKERIAISLRKSKRRY